MKVMVATSARSESREMPHTPCPRRAAIAPHRAEPDQNACKNERRRTGRDRLQRQSSGRSERHERRGDNARDKGEPSCQLIVLVWRKQPRSNPADTRDAPGQRHQHHGGQSDQRASNRGGERREGRNGHSVELLRIPSPMKGGNNARLVLARKILPCRPITSIAKMWEKGLPPSACQPR
jgi:hypothetical protein